MGGGCWDCCRERCEESVDHGAFRVAAGTANRSDTALRMVLALEPGPRKIQGHGVEDGCTAQVRRRSFAVHMPGPGRTQDLAVENMCKVQVTSRWRLAVHGS